MIHAHAIADNLINEKLSLSEKHEQLCYNECDKINALGIAIATRQGGLPNHFPKPHQLGVA